MTQKSEQNQYGQGGGEEQTLPPQLVELVRLLARQAAREAIEASRTTIPNHGD